MWAKEGSKYSRDPVRVRGADGDRGHAVYTVGGYAFDKFMLILPAAASRNIATNGRRYTLYAVEELVSGVSVLILSFYLNTSAAAIAWCSAALYFVTLGLRAVMHR